MFKIESYVTPILLSYVDKYVRDFKPGDAQVSLWGGGVALHNLVLKADVLQQEVSLPFTLVSGRIHELLIQVPWTKIMSEPIVVTIDTIECVLNQHRPSDVQPPEPPSRKTQVVEAPPGYMQALVRRIVSNIALRVHHLIVKYVQDDIVMSLNVKHLAVDSAGVNWEPAFADIDQNQPCIRRTVRLDDFTLCLDKADADGKIRFYQEPLLYRCRLDLRVLTYLVSANTRRASSIAVQLCSSKLAWSVTSDQLTLLLRLVLERAPTDVKVPPSTPKQPASPPSSQTTMKSHSAEPTRSGSWSDWAWSWLPSLSDKEGGVEDVPPVPTPLPIGFDAYLDEVSLAFKVIELDSQTRKRFRSVLEMSASFAAVKSAACMPTSIRLQFGARDISLRSYGKCVCGFTNYDASCGKPTIYLKRVPELDDASEPWQWPANTLMFGQTKIETAEAAEEQPRVASDEGVPDVEQEPEQPRLTQPTSQSMSIFLLEESNDLLEDADDLWRSMSPVLFLEFKHTRSPPCEMNPYDNPPKDFQYSDWIEECCFKVKVQPIECKMTVGLMHRLGTIKDICHELTIVPTSEQLMRVLTIEECDALHDNMPERRWIIEVQGLQIHLVPWDHSLTERPARPPLMLVLELPKINMSISGPLYPHRICAAACQLPQYVGPLWKASRLTISMSVSHAQLLIASATNKKQKPCARADIRLIIHVLLNKSYFTKHECEFDGYSSKISELNICGSAARLHAAWQVVSSVINEEPSFALKYSSLAQDALSDEDAVAVDITLEGLVLRGYRTKHLNTYVITLTSGKATVFHEPLPGNVKQAWIFSAPDSTTASPYLRLGVQWSDEITPETFEYIGVWAEPTAISIDPLFISWLAYKPLLNNKSYDATSTSSTKAPSASYLLRKRPTIERQSSSGRGGSRSAGSAELVHMRTRASTVSSEPSEKRKSKTKKPVIEKWWQGEQLVALHERLRSMLINIEVGLVQVYITMSTASALDCATLRDAMERHAVTAHRVAVFSLGRLAMSSNISMGYLWEEVRHDAPTLIRKKAGLESFPWKLKLADVSCYTLEPRADRPAEDGPRSSMKERPAFAYPHTVLDLVTTTVTVSVVTKALTIKNFDIPPAPKKETPRSTPTTTAEYKTRYFTAGKVFKPSTLQEFFRGPRRSLKKENKESQSQNASDEANSASPVPDNAATERVTVTTGPIVSLGVHLHADTPPIVIKVDHEQIHVVAAAIHCFQHIVTLLRQDSITVPKPRATTTSVSHQKIPSVSELEDPARTISEDTRSKSSDIIEIYDRTAVPVRQLTTFVWFQWVISRGTVVFASNKVKMAFDIEDIISTVDIQTHYNQLKIKVTSASVKHYKNQDGDWVPGVLDGRVIEAREMIGARDEDHFLAVTITQAQVSELPDSWKEELHPKLLEQQKGEDSMWEIYATLAPLDVIIQPVIIENVASLLAEMAPRSSCDLKRREESRVVSPWQLPFIYLAAGGMRLLLTGQQETADYEDTLVLNVGRVSINPHPDNPICRRLVNAPVDGSWLISTLNHEGRQYEINVRHLAIRSAVFKELVSVESHELLKNMNENPALKWSKEVAPPTISPLLYPVDICCVFAPALYLGGVLTCGPAVEVNLITDCAIEFSLQQIMICEILMQDLRRNYNVESKGQFRNELKDGKCAYASLLRVNMPEVYFSEPAVPKEESDLGLAEDSGVETTSSRGISKTRTNLVDDPNYKKSVSILLSEQIADASEYMEVFVTMGTILLTLHVEDDGSSDVVPLRPLYTVTPEEMSQPVQRNPSAHSPEQMKSPDVGTGGLTNASRSLTERVRDCDVGLSKVDLEHFSRKIKMKNIIPLVSMTIQQPNIYYWRKKGLKNIQVSMFNISMGLGSLIPGSWSLKLLSTAKGAPDPVTDIPPALATLKIVAPVSCSQYTSANVRGSIRLEVERPVQLDVCCERIRRVRAIVELIRKQLVKVPLKKKNSFSPVEHPLLYRLREKMFAENIESVVLNMGQVGVYGTEGTVGWDSLNCQLAVGGRPERLVARALVTALVVSSGNPSDIRHVVLQPLMFGVQMEAVWESWRRAEGGLFARVPVVHMGVDFDRVIVDLRPAEFAACMRVLKNIQILLAEGLDEDQAPREAMNREHSEPLAPLACRPHTWGRGSSLIEIQSNKSGTSIASDASNQYYKDDLRSGAFKILKGGQLPMAYQVMLHGNAVSWRYPHPRAITRVVVFPLPGVNVETPCVLELYTPLLDKWEPHTYFNIPVGDPKEIQLYVPPPEAIFASMWRFRTCEGPQQNAPEFQFNINDFTPRTEPLSSELPLDDVDMQCKQGVTAEQLSGVVRVDSYFAPLLLPSTRVILRMVLAEIHVHNSLPKHASADTTLEGYYVSRPLMRSHRVLSFIVRNAKLHGLLGSPSGVVYVLDTNLSADIMDCGTGTMEQLVGDFRLQAGLSAGSWTGADGRARVSTTHVHVALQVPRLRSFRALIIDWQDTIDKCAKEDLPSEFVSKEEESEEMSVEEASQKTTAALEGRVFLWVQNSCASALRIGQEGTDEVVPLGPGAVLAYRWRSPVAPKRLRFALADPTANWHWSTSLPFAVGSKRVRLEEAELSDKKITGIRNMGMYLHVRVDEVEAKRTMHLSGILLLANMLRLNLLYKVRMRCVVTGQWRTLCSDEMAGEYFGRSVICNADAEMVLKIKLTTHESGWSGDIPLKECPKENVPWLVKVPSSGEMSFLSVWCRVTRARHDGRILATVWPLYVLHSHLPLDTDVLITTDAGTSPKSELERTPSNMPPLVQSTPGRGTCTHLLSPGTTANKHSLSFQYRNIECPVTREAVPMHYGVTDVSVFDKRLPVMHIDEVKQDIVNWLARSGRHARTNWPYSIVAKHWQGQWRPALLQPRCDVTVRYQAVHAGGGCCLEIQLAPIVMFCNAAPVALTLRSYDASPLCKLESGTAISPPSPILTKPFYISIEIGRETFVSEKLEVSSQEPGRYGSLPSGHVALDHDARIAILCNQKVALLTMYYEIKHDINILGVSSTYVLINRLDTPVLASPIAIPMDDAKDTFLLAKTFKVVQPTKAGSIHGTPLTRFWLRGRWKGGTPLDLRTYLLLALPAADAYPANTTYPATTPVPVRLGITPIRRAISLLDKNGVSVPITVTKIKHESRWLVVIAHDPCPQFVVHNHTSMSMLVAQPLPMQQDYPSTSEVKPVRECPGAVWWCKVRPNAKIHYSTPDHCSRYPPMPTAPALPPPSVQLLTFGKKIEEESYEWSAPVAAAEGEQLLQYYGGVTIKLRVHSHPHSTLLVLKDTDQNDISPSDIRRRLHGATWSNEAIPRVSIADLDRTDAAYKLLQHNQDSPILEDVTSIADDQSDSPKLVKRIPSVLFAEGTRTSTISSSDIKDTDSQLHFNQPSNEQNESSSCETSFSDMALSGADWPASERLRFVMAGLVVEISASADVPPLLALHVDRSVLLLMTDEKTTRTIVSVADIQVDNMQYESGQFDFAVVASTRSEPLPTDPWPPLWNIFGNNKAFRAKHDEAKLLVNLNYDEWYIQSHHYRELTEIEIKMGSLALYVEDAYVKALIELSGKTWPALSSHDAAPVLAEERALQRPLRLRRMYIHPLDLTLTLHTAVRMYIALDQSPLRLSAFKLHDMMTSADRLTHALTVHYLSAAILGAGWVVGGLELLGAPGALAARLGGATGGVKGVASATAAALLRSLSAWAGSLARNLDLLAGDEEHARRAAAARRRPPPSFVAGLVAGLTNFAINILGAVGGLAHHPLVGVAVGETESSTAALRRGLLGALTKPLSATADLVAYAGHGLLRQTGWDPIPKPRRAHPCEMTREQGGWRRDCVRWTFRLADMYTLAGYEVLLDNAPLQLLLTHKYLVVADPETERIVEMIDFRCCSLKPYSGQTVELSVRTQRKSSRAADARAFDDEDEYQISAAAMARVARYTGSESAGGGQPEYRLLSLLLAPGKSQGLHAALTMLLHNNMDTHLSLL